jgi:hypothetical protein
LAQLAADGSGPLERLVARLLSLLEHYEAARRRIAAGSHSTPRTVADAAAAAREKRALRQAAVVECLLEHAAFALCGALKAATAAGDSLRLLGVADGLKPNFVFYRMRIYELSGGLPGSRAPGRSPPCVAVPHVESENYASAGMSLRGILLHTDDAKLLRALRGLLLLPPPPLPPPPGLHAVVVGAAVLAQDVEVARAMVENGVPALVKALLGEGNDRDVRFAAAACVATLTAHAAPTQDDPLVRLRESE